MECFSPREYYVQLILLGGSPADVLKAWHWYHCRFTIEHAGFTGAVGTPSDKSLHDATRPLRVLDGDESPGCAALAVRPLGCHCGRWLVTGTLVSIQMERVPECNLQCQESWAYSLAFETQSGPDTPCCPSNNCNCAACS